MKALRYILFFLLSALLLGNACGKKFHSSVSCDARAFIVDDERLQITATALQYFRIPADLWSDRILKAKRSGINTIETAVPWNYHEPKEGSFTFNGDYDLERFLTLCEQANMYIILRPGPFLFANTDFIDYPVWLRTKKGQPLGVDDPIFIGYLDRFYKNLYPVIQKHLWNKGGNIILIQVENNNTPSFDNNNKLAQHIIDWWRNLKLEIPLASSTPGSPEFRQCLPVKQKNNPGPDYQKMLPAVPLNSSDLQPVQYNFWGQNSEQSNADDLIFQTLKILSLGGNEINYTAFHSSSNFDYHTLYLQTTTNNNHSAIREAGGFSAAWFKYKRVNQFANTFAPFFLYDEPSYTLDYQVNDSLTLRVREKDSTRMLFLENKFPKCITSNIIMNNDTLGAIFVSPSGIAPVVINYPLGKTGMINYSTAFIQNIFTGLDKKHYILLSGVPGSPATIKLSGENTSRVFDINFSPENTVSSFKFEQFVVLVANEQMAGRMQIMDINKGQIAVFGPELVRSWKVTGDKIKLEADVTPQCHQAFFYGDGKGGISAPVQALERRSDLPQPENWSYRKETPVWDTDYDDSDWLAIKDPTSMLLMSNNLEEYGWYRARFDSPAEGISKLSFTGVADRLTVWLNGEKTGSSLAPSPDQTGKLPVTFTVKVRKGVNVLVVMADNLGLHQYVLQGSHSLFPEDKGLFGPVYIGFRALPITDWRFKSSLAGESEQWYQQVKSFKSIKNYKANNTPAWFAASFKINNDLFKSIPPLRINMNTMSKGVVWLNGRMLGRHWNIGPEDRLYLPESWLERKNTLIIFDENGLSPERVRLLWDQENNLNPASITYSYK